MFFKPYSKENIKVKKFPFTRGNHRYVSSVFVCLLRKCLCLCKHVSPCVYLFFLKHDWDRIIHSFLWLAFLTVVSSDIRTCWSISFCLRDLSSAMNSLIPDFFMAHSSSPYLNATFSVMPFLAALSKMSVPPLSLPVSFSINDFFLALIICILFLLFIVCSSTVMYTLMGRNLWLSHSLPNLHSNVWPRSRCSINICRMNEWVIMLFFHIWVHHNLLNNPLLIDI